MSTAIIILCRCFSRVNARSPVMKEEKRLLQAQHIDERIRRGTIRRKWNPSSPYCRAMRICFKDKHKKMAKDGVIVEDPFQIVETHSILICTVYGITVSAVEETLKNHLRANHNQGPGCLSKRVRKEMVNKYKTLSVYSPNQMFALTAPIDPIDDLDLKHGIQCRVDECDVICGTMGSVKKHLLNAQITSSSWNPNE